MWFSKEKGKLEGNDKTLSRLLNCSDIEFNQFLDEAIQLEFCYVTVTCNANVTPSNKNVTLINRRMYREHKERENTRLRVRRHREKQPRNENVTVPSSSSSSTPTPKIASKIASKSKSSAFSGKNAGLTTRRKRKLKGHKLELFLEFWDAFGDKRGKAEATDAWLDIKWPENIDQYFTDEILPGAKDYAKYRPILINGNHTPKMAQGWISGRRWEDEIPKQPETPGEQYARIAREQDERDATEA